MTSESPRTRIGIAVAIAATLLGGTLLLRGRTAPDAGNPAQPSPAVAQPRARPETDAGTASATVATDEPRHRLAKGGRLQIAAASLPAGGALVLALDIEDAARGDGIRSALVVGMDGRRLEGSTSALPGEGRGVRLEIDADFLTPGQYLLQIDTVGAHPLRGRRYVIEVL